METTQTTFFIDLWTAYGSFSIQFEFAGNKTLHDLYQSIADDLWQLDNETASFALRYEDNTIPMNFTRFDNFFVGSDSNIELVLYFPNFMNANELYLFNS
jgi:hypothetical protein